MLSHLPVSQVQETAAPSGSKLESALRGHPPAANVTRLHATVTKLQFNLSKIN
ncbi:hypothetical protein J2X12_002694 [Pseudarthrobacter oxydans]|uniref:Uncharacterized protein n=1 Tax=Pseudarthrobacter oxydans TaxID=1671 RepID=A0AAW8NAY1_PSEOX|nr:hypothetical protein [Pseudarthrobacter oxydans]MDR7164656.1 hypothetical protein [Pseudarthrobacter oxydans]